MNTIDHSVTSNAVANSVAPLGQAAEKVARRRDKRRADHDRSPGRTRDTLETHLLTLEEGDAASAASPHIDGQVPQRPASPPPVEGKHRLQTEPEALSADPKAAQEKAPPVRHLDVTA